MIGRRLEAFRQSDDLVVDTCLAGSFLYLLEGCVRFAVTDVLLYGSVENMVLLQHQTDVFTQEAGIPFTEVDSVQSDCAAVRFIKLVKQIHDGRLARSAQSYKGGYLAAVDFQGNVIQCFCSVGICEVNTLHLEIALHFFWPVIARRFQFSVSIDNVKVSFSIDQSIVQVIENALKRRDWSSHIREQHDVIHNLTDGHSRVADKDQIGCKDDDQDRSGLAYETFQRVEPE